MEATKLRPTTNRRNLVHNTFIRGGVGEAEGGGTKAIMGRPKETRQEMQFLCPLGLGSGLRGRTCVALSSSEQLRAAPGGEHCEQRAVVEVTAFGL